VPWESVKLLLVRGIAHMASKVVEGKNSPGTKPLLSGVGGAVTGSGVVLSVLAELPPPPPQAASRVSAVVNNTARATKRFSRLMILSTPFQRL